MVHHVEAEARLEVVRLEVAQDRFSSVSILASTAVNFRVLEPDRHLEAVVHEDVSANTSAADKPGSTSSDPSWEAAVCRAERTVAAAATAPFGLPFRPGESAFPCPETPPPTLSLLPACSSLCEVLPRIRLGGRRVILLRSTAKWQHLPYHVAHTCRGVRVLDDHVVAQVRVVGDCRGRSHTTLGPSAAARGRSTCGRLSSKHGPG